MANETTAAPPQGTVEGVTIAKVDRELLIRQMLGVGLRPSDVASTETLVMQMNAHYKKKYPDEKSREANLVRCQVDTGGCGGLSDVSLDACPYCGLGDEPKEKKEGEGKKVRGAPKTPAANAPTAEIEKAAKAKKTEAAIVVHEAPELDAAVEKVVQLKSNLFANHVEMGLVLQGVFDNETWKQRKDDKGRIVHKGGFAAWVKAECGMSDVTARNIMNTVKQFGAHAAKTFGYVKLTPLLKVAQPEDQIEIIENYVKKGASKREIEAAVREKRAQRGVAKGQPVRGGGGKTAKATAAAAGKSGRKAKHPTTVTAIALLERTKLPMYTRDTRRAKEENRKPAKRVGDGPWAEWKLDNHVTLYLAVSQNSAGELQVIIEGKRDDD